MNYKSLFNPHQAQSCLTPSCQRAIREVENYGGVSPPRTEALKNILREFANLPPEITARAAPEIRTIAKLHPIRHANSTLTPRARFVSISLKVKDLEANPLLAMLYLFHGEGQLRQAALHRVTSDMLSPFLFTAIAMRLNDWAPPVRQEAARCLARITATNDLTKIAPAIPFLCLQSKTWRRWKEDRAAFEKIEASPEVAAYMAQHLRTGRQGPLPRQCRAMLRHEAFDAHLLELAHSAATPNVRAIALGALLKQKASWITGRQKRWVDKPYGISRMDAVWAHRPITVPVDTSALVCFGANNRAVAVRRTVAYWLLTAAESHPEAVALLSKDKYPSVREAMEYYKRKQAENA